MQPDGKQSLRQVEHRLLMDFAKSLKILMDFLIQQGIDFALIGGFALNSFGLTRTTDDIDIVMHSDNASPVIDFLESLGYETLFRSEAFSNHEHPFSGLVRIDILYVSGETAVSLLNECHYFPIFTDCRIKVVKPEHLIALKLFSISSDPQRYNRDIEDIRYLLTLGNLNFEETKKYFEKYSSIGEFEKLMEKRNDRF